MTDKRIIKLHDIFLIFVATSVALISNILIGLFDGSMFSIMKIIIISFSNVLGVFLVTAFICIILKLFGFKFK